MWSKVSPGTAAVVGLVLVCVGVVGLPGTASAQTLIGADEATTLVLPDTPGGGVFIDVHNQIGGGQAPQPAHIADRTPTGSTLSPFIDFPRPGNTIRVGDSFTLFFASTTTPPEVLRNTAARNFILDIRMLLRIEEQFDLNPSTPAIDVSIRVGSDDGFHLTVGDTFIGQTGDRGFNWSAYNLAFESPGLYPVRLLFAANATGFSGLELQWNTALTSGWDYIPQAAMYLAETGCVDEFTFEDLALLDIPGEQYADRGIRFHVVSGGVVVTNERPLEFIPVSGDRVIGDPDPESTETGFVEVSFWASDGFGGMVPGETDEVGLYVINANEREGGSGARVAVRGAGGVTLFDQVYNGGVGSQQPVSIVAPGILTLSLELGAGLSAAAVDNLCIGVVRPAPADLAGGGVAVEGTPVFGSPGLIRWDTTNLGGTPSGSSWVQSVYLSVDDILDESDLLLAGTVTGLNLAYLDDAEVSVSVPLPLDIEYPEGFYRLIVVLDSAGSISEIDESNNTLVSEPTLFARPPLPDLRPDGVAAAESSSFVGGEIDVTWTVRNIGHSDATGPWIDRVYLSPTAEIGPNAVALQPDEIVAGPVVAGVGIYQRRVVFALPDLPEGDYFVIVDVNQDDGAGELENRANNTAVSTSTFRVEPPPRPDLEVVTLTPPANLPPGSTVSLTWTVRNNGPGPVDAMWTERVYGSLDAILGNGNDQLVGSFNYTTSLSPGESVQRTESITVPQVPPGGYWAIVQVDAENVVAETNEANNILAAQVCVNCQTPDLVVNVVTGPDDAIAGTSATVSWTVRNIGAGSASGSWADRVYLSTDASAGGDTLLGEIRWSSGLASGSNYNRSLSVVIPPETEGPVWFVVTTDALNELSEPGGEENNTSVAQQATMVALPELPDLRVVSGQINTPSPVFGGSVSLSWTVDNIGPVAAVGPWIDRAFLSRDTTLDTSDVPLTPTRATPVAPLPPGGAYGSSLEVDLPLSAALDDGEYYVLLQTDGGSLVSEQRESNNILAVGPIMVIRPSLPDLIVASISTPSGGNPGELVEVVWTTRNIGQADAPLPWRERLLLVLENGTEVLAANLDAPAPLAPGAHSEPRVAMVNVPAQGNSFRVRIRVDANNQVLESAEDNNTLTSGESPIFRPDVIVSNILTDSTAVAGEMLAVSWEIANIGLGSTYTYFLDRVSIESGGVSHFLGIFPQNAPIPAGQSVPVSVSFPLPDRIEGEYTVRVFTDSTDSLIETGPPSNNIATSASTVHITQPARPDLIVEQISLPADGLVGSASTVGWRVRNISSDVPADGPWIDRVVAVPVSGSPGETVQLALFTRTQGLAPGASYDAQADIHLPGLAGLYEVEVRTDNGDQVNEGLEGGEDNNALRQGVFEAGLYAVSAFASIESGLAGTPVSVSGQAIGPGDTAIADVPVSLALAVQGTVRRLSAQTDATGAYTVALPLGPTEAGVYTLFAGPTPEETASQVVPSDAFTLFGIAMTNPARGPVVTVDSSSMSAIEVRNSGDTPLSAPSIVLLDAPTGVSFAADTGSVLAPRERRQVGYEIFADPDAVPGVHRLTVAALTNEGAQAVAEIEFLIRPAQPRLTANPGVLRSGMLRGLPDEPRLTTVEFSVTNTGAAPTGAITVQLPSTSWLSLSSPAQIDSLEPGQSAGVVLNLLPGSALPLGPYTGNLVIGQQNGPGLSVPYEFNLVSDGVGDLEVLVEDELTYWADGANGEPLGPMVAGATVQLLNSSTGQLFASSMTDSQGRAFFAGLPEGGYDIVVTGPNHRSERTVVGIFRGRQSSARIFLYRSMVRYTWDVYPYAIDDSYRIILNAEFETFVPFPVLEVTPGYVDLTQYVGETVQIDFEITNRGLVSAEQVEIGVGTDGRWRVTPLISDIGEIPAGQSITVPVIFEDTFNFGRGAGGGGNAGDPCSFRVSLSVAHRKYCGPVLRTYTVGVHFRLPDIFCPGFDPPPPPSWTWDGDNEDDPPPNNQGPNNNTSAPPCGCYEVAVVYFTGGSAGAQGTNGNFIAKGAELMQQYPGRVAARTFASSHCPSQRRDEAANWVRSLNAPDCPCGEPKVIIVGHSAGGDTAHYSAANPSGMNVAYTLLIDPINRDLVDCFLCLELVPGDSDCVDPTDRTNQRDCLIGGPIDEVHIAHESSPIPIGCGIFGQTTNESWGYSVPGAVEIELPPGTNHNNASSRGLPWENSVDVQVERLLQAGCGNGG